MTAGAAASGLGRARELALREGHACEIAFQPLGRRVQVARGTTLLDAARAIGLRLASDCGGEGTCGRCQVAVLGGETSPIEELERNVFSGQELAAGSRLACRAEALGDLTVQVPESSLWQEQRLQVHGSSAPLEVDPAIRRRELQCPPPALEDPRSDTERVFQALDDLAGVAAWTADPAAVRQLSPLARRVGWRLTAYLRGTEAVGFAAGGRRPLGLAVDVGSTKIAAYLLDLETGEELGASGIMNPQIGYGEDVIARLAHACRSAEGADELTRVVREAIDGLAGALAERAGVSREQIVDACVVGNTAMTHLYLSLPVEQLAVSPFVAAAGNACDVKAREMCLAIAPGAYVHVLPTIGGFVGADHVAAILAGGVDRSERVTLGIDIGTNTEIVVSHPGRGALASASCASGPAFEGAHIRDGMRAAPGAIEAVRLTPEGLRVETIQGAPPCGLCGSGIVDAVAELRRNGILDERGRLRTDAPGVRRAERGFEYVLVPAEASGPGRDIVLTQQDVGEIQLAKGAILAGIQTLLEATGTAPAEVEEVLIAGAFGSHLNLESVLSIGLLPRLPKARFLQVGNAAGVGAKMALLSRKERARAARIARRTRYVELNLDSGFGRRFAQAMRFPAEADRRGEGISP